MQDPVINELKLLVMREGTIKNAAEKLGVSSPLVCMMLSGDRNVSPRIAERLGYKKMWVKVTE